MNDLLCDGLTCAYTASGGTKFPSRGCGGCGSMFGMWDAMAGGRAYFLGAAMLAAAAAGVAQEPALQQRSAPQLSARPPAAQSDESRNIQLDVQVEDALGRPVSGLQAKDFVVLDNSGPEKIATFSSNVQRSEPLEIIFVMDALSSTFEDIARSKQQLSGFLRQSGGQLSQPVTIVWLEKSGTKGRSKNADVAVPDIIPIEKGAAYLHVIPASTDGITLAKKLDASDIFVSGSLAAQGISSAQVRLSLQALEVIASGSAGRPSRKLVIWVSPGWPLLSEPNSKMREQLFDYIVYLYGELRRARVTLYSVDPQGVSTAFNSDGPVARPSNWVLRAGIDYANSGVTMTPAQPGSYSAYLKSPMTVKQALPNAVSLQVLAYQTGGLVLGQGNDIGGDIARCVADANSYYTLEYEAPAAKQVNEYHATQVKVDRAGVSVRTRTGYYAQPTGTH